MVATEVTGSALRAILTKGPPFGTMTVALQKADQDKQMPLKVVGFPGLRFTYDDCLLSSKRSKKVCLQKLTSQNRDFILGSTRKKSETPRFFFRGAATEGVKFSLSSWQMLLPSAKDSFLSRVNPALDMGDSWSQRDRTQRPKERRRI